MAHRMYFRVIVLLVEAHVGLPRRETLLQLYWTEGLRQLMLNLVQLLDTPLTVRNVYVLDQESLHTPLQLAFLLQSPDQFRCELAHYNNKT